MVISMPPRKPEPKTQLGIRLAVFIASKGYPNIRAASAASGLNYQQLWDLISTEKDPRVSTLERIVEALGGTMAEFYTALPKDQQLFDPRIHESND